MLQLYCLVVSWECCACAVLSYCTETYVFYKPYTFQSFPRQRVNGAMACGGTQELKHDGITEEKQGQKSYLQDAVMHI